MLDQYPSPYVISSKTPVSDHPQVQVYREYHDYPINLSPTINQHHHHAQKKPFRPQDPYPTPPPSPDLGELEIALGTPLDPHTTDKITQSETIRRENTSAQTQLPTPTQTYQPNRKTPAIPISLLLNTPHTLPHAPFKLLHPSGILSALGGNRILHVEGAGRILDRMPYSPSSTNGVILTKDQAEEDNVEVMLGGESSSSTMSPDQS